MFTVEQMYYTIFQPFLFLGIFRKRTGEAGNRTGEAGNRTGEAWKRTEEQY